MRTSTLVSMLLPLALSVTAVGCHRSAQSDQATATAEDAVGQDALVEEHETGTVAWNIRSDGQVKALVRTSDNKPVTGKVDGSLTWKAGGDAPKMIVLSPDAKASGLLVATGPKLDADLTEVGYTLAVEGKPWTGTLHLPPGGTAELAANAKAAAQVNLQAKVGPHGGVLQVVGTERYEIVQNEASGEVRVYLLDPDLKVVAVGDRKITLGVVADSPQVVVLVPEPEAGLYVRGKVNLKVDPARVTLAVREGTDVHVAIVGWAPGAHLVVGANAPRVNMRVKAAAFAKLDTDVDMKARVKVKAPEVDVKLKVPEPNIKVEKDVGVKAKAKAGAGANAGASAGAGAKASAGAGAKVKIGL